MTKIEELKLNFVQSATEHGRGTATGNPVSANEAHGKLVETIHALRELDPELTSIASLLVHEDLSVGAWAATYLLPYQTEKSLKLLDEISTKKGLVAFSAGVTANEWRAGRLKLL